MNFSSLVSVEAVLVKNRKLKNTPTESIGNFRLKTQALLALCFRSQME
jgi:hypothetical protein